MIGHEVKVLSCARGGLYQSLGRTSFMERVVELWNRLPSYVDMALRGLVQ